MDPQIGRHAESDAAPRDAFGPEAFARQFRENFRLFWLIAAGIVRDHALAEDVVQEAAVIGLQKLDQFNPSAPGSSFAAWMGQIVRFVALNQSRRIVKRQTASMDPAALDQATDRLDRASARAERPVLTDDGQIEGDQGHFDDRVMAALDHVNPTARACLLLRTIEGLDYASISLLLDIPEGTAMSHVHRSRKLLRTRLSATQGPLAAKGTSRERRHERSS